MWLETKAFADDLKNINDVRYIPWEKLEGKTVFITGATGIIGYTVVCSLLYRNYKYNSSIKIVALVRNIEKAKIMFSEQFMDGSISNLEFIIGEITSPISYNGEIDYIIHGASPTASRFFAYYPVETIDIVVNGTMNILNFAKEKQVAGFLYMSSMEVYGAPHTDESIEENFPSNLNTMSVRSCYPEGKRMAECLCVSYFSEYGTNAMVARLAQTFGPGVLKNDTRVFAEFARCAMEGKDIILQTKGDSKRCYLYIADAVTAIFTILLKGEGGNAYNVANKYTYCSIAEMANMVASEIAKDKIKVNIQMNSQVENEKKFSPPHQINLSSDKVNRLGWEARVSLRDMYLRMMECMR